MRWHKCRWLGQPAAPTHVVQICSPRLLCVLESVSSSSPHVQKAAPRSCDRQVRSRYRRAFTRVYTNPEKRLPFAGGLTASFASRAAETTAKETCLLTRVVITPPHPELPQTIFFQYQLDIFVLLNELNFSHSGFAPNRPARRRPPLLAKPE